MFVYTCIYVSEYIHVYNYAHVCLCALLCRLCVCMCAQARVCERPATYYITVQKEKLKFRTILKKVTSLAHFNVKNQNLTMTKIGNLTAPALL